MRIGHLTTIDMSLALLLATELTEGVAAGHDMVGLSAPGPYVERIEALDVEFVPQPRLTRAWDLRSDAAAFADLVRTLRRLRLDVLHTHNPKTGVLGRLAGRLARVPVVVNTCHGLWARAEDPLPRRLFVYGAEALAIRFSDFELFQNAEDERTLRRVLKRGRHRVVGNGVDLDRFRFDPEGRQRVRAEWGVADDTVLVGTVGRRVTEKGLAEFTLAAQALADRASFAWVGPADDTDSAAAAASSASDGVVQFVAERTDMPAVYSAFDVFVLASHREGLSRASMEAAACGRPIVLTDIRGCREIGDDGVEVLRFPAGDAAALTRRLVELLDDPARAAGLGEAAHERAQRTFDQRAVAAASRDVYEQVLRRKRRVGREATR